MPKMNNKLLFKAFEKQEEFIIAAMSGKYSFILYGGAVRGGKTYVILGLFIILCHYYPNSRFVVVRKDLEILKSTTLNSFYEIVPSSITAKMPSQHNGWNWVHANGSRIKFFSENLSRDPDLKRFRGLEYDSIAFDEMDISEQTFRKAFERKGTWRMKDRQEAVEKGETIPPQLVLGTSNPQTGWVKEDIYNPYIAGTLNKKWHYIVSRVYDNPYVSETWIEDQRDNMLPEDFEQFIEGDWEVFRNKKKWLNHYDDKLHYSRGESFALSEHAMTWICFDFNYDPTTCTVFQIFDTGILAMRSYAIEGGTKALCDYMKEDRELMKIPSFLWNITGDTSGASKSSTSGDTTDYDIIRDEFNLSNSQFYLNNKNKALEYSRRLCDWFLLKVPFMIDSSCKGLRNDLLIAKPEKNGQGLYKNRAQGYGMDLLDNFRYFVDAKFPGGKDDIDSFSKLIKSKRA